MRKLIIDTILLPFVMEFIKDLLTRENVDIWLDKLFDFIEDTVINSETKWDDKLVLPIIAQMRAALAVPDND